MRASLKCHFLEIMLIRHKEFKYSSFMVDRNLFFIKDSFEKNPFYFTDRVCLCQVWFKHSKNTREHYNQVLLTNKLKNYTLNFRLCIFLCVWGFSIYVPDVLLYIRPPQTISILSWKQILLALYSSGSPAHYFLLFLCSPSPCCF